jgi:hypothetical protein
MPFFLRLEYQDKFKQTFYPIAKLISEELESRVEYTQFGTFYPEWILVRLNANTEKLAKVFPDFIVRMNSRTKIFTSGIHVTEQYAIVGGDKLFDEILNKLRQLIDLWEKMKVKNFDMQKFCEYMRITLNELETDYYSGKIELK